MSKNTLTVLEAAKKMGLQLNRNQLSSLGTRMINKHSNLYVEHGKRGNTIVRLYKDVPEFYEEVAKEYKDMNFKKKS
jgi:hypothetical protein